MSEEVPDSLRVIITRNDLQVRIKKPFDLNLGIAQNRLPATVDYNTKINFNIIDITSIFLYPFDNY